MNRWRQAEGRRLVAASERLARRRDWWAVQRDASAARVDELTAQLAEAAAKVDALEAATAKRPVRVSETSRTGRGGRRHAIGDPRTAA